MARNPMDTFAIAGTRILRTDPLIRQLENERAKIQRNPSLSDDACVMVGKFAERMGWTNGLKEFCGIISVDESEAGLPPALGVHNDKTYGDHEDSLSNNLTVLVYLHPAEDGGGLEIYSRKVPGAPGESSSHEAMFAISTRLPNTATCNNDTHVQVLGMRRGTWHRREPHKGRRVVAILFEKE